MRIPMLLPVCVVAGCVNPTPSAIGIADGASVAVFGRGVVDIGVSAVTGRDCSVVRLDKGQTYCAPTDPPPPERICTRTLATVDCWPDTAGPARTGVGDTPPAKRSTGALSNGTLAKIPHLRIAPMLASRRTPGTILRVPRCCRHRLQPERYQP